MAINNIKIKKYTSSSGVGTSTIEISSLPSVEQIKISRYSNEEFDTAEIVFTQLGRNNYKMFDRIALEDDYFNWYIAGQNIQVVDKVNDIYRVTLDLIEITQKLKNYKVSNLSFNQFQTDSTTKLYPTLFDIVDRVRLLTPFELKSNVNITRVTYGILPNNYIGKFKKTASLPDPLTDPDYAQTIEWRLYNLETRTEWYWQTTIDEEQWINTTNNTAPTIFGYTDKLYDLLLAQTDVKEFQFIDRNLYEVYSEIFLDLGGVPRIIANTDGDNILDITLFDDTTLTDKDINVYEKYTDVKNINNYATNAEITTNNIINVDSPYVSGDIIGKMLQSEELVIDENIAIASLETPIYRLIKAEVSVVTDTTSWKTITQYVKSREEFKLLDTGVGATDYATVQNSVYYELGGTFIKGWGKNATAGGVAIWATAVWHNMFSHAGVALGDRDLTDYKFRFTYETIMRDNRFNVKQINYDDDNKNASLRINSGERVNEYDKIVNLAQNRLSRLGARQIMKEVVHATIDDVYPIGTYDLDTNFKIANSEVLIIRDVIRATYVLTPDLNILSEFVGVNTENRFTDIEIGGGLKRNETFEDWVLATTDTDIQFPLTTSNTITMSAIFAELYKKLTPPTMYNHFLIDSADMVYPAIVPAIVSAGSRTLSFRLPLLSQTFVDNELTAPVMTDTEPLQQRYFEKGVRYTQNNGLLNTMSLTYGQKVTISDSDVENRAYPKAGETLDTNTSSMFNIGTTDITSTSEFIYLSNEEKIETFSGVTLPGETRTTTITKTYTINDTLDLFSFKIQGVTDTLARSAHLNVSITDSYGNITPAYYVRPYVAYSGEILEFDGQFDRHNLLLGGLDIESITITFSITSLKPALASVTNELYMQNIYYIKRITTSTSNDGLLVDKNQNEILTIEYMNHFSSLDNEIIIGDGLTNKCQFMKGFDKFDSIDVYVSNEKYSQYDTKKIKGSIDATFDLLIGNTAGAATPEFSIELIDVDPETPTDISNKSYAIVGTLNGEKHLLHAVNTKRGELQPNKKVRFIWSHYNPKVVTNY